MRLKTILAAAAAIVTLGLAEPGTASADGAKEKVRCCQAHKHRVPLRAAYVIEEDPYAYQYSPRGYYPYYGSHMWVPAGYIRARNRLHYNVWNQDPPRFRYYKSWGYPKPWNHHAWHKAHHGRHHRWHW